MDGRRINAVTDESLDREIESLLAVEPSPEFLARVRTRVAEEPAPIGWRLPWMFGAAATVAAVVVALIVWPSADVAPSLVVMPSSHAPAEPARITEADPAVAPDPVTSLQPVAVRAVAVAGEREIDIDLPDVVLGENEVKAYAALVTSIRQSHFGAAVPAVPNPDTPIEIKELPPVEPLEIEPIVRVAALQTEGEHP